MSHSHCPQAVASCAFIQRLSVRLSRPCLYGWLPCPARPGLAQPSVVRERHVAARILMSNNHLPVLLSLSLSTHERTSLGVVGTGTSVYRKRRLPACNPPIFREFGNDVALPVPDAACTEPFPWNNVSDSPLASPVSVHAAARCAALAGVQSGETPEELPRWPKSTSTAMSPMCVGSPAYLASWLALAFRGTSIADPPVRSADVAISPMRLFPPPPPLFRLRPHLSLFTPLLLPFTPIPYSQIYGDLDESKPSVSTSTPNQSTSTAATSSGGQDAKVRERSRMLVHWHVKPI